MRTITRRPSDDPHARRGAAAGAPSTPASGRRSGARPGRSPLWAVGAVATILVLLTVVITQGVMLRQRNQSLATSRASDRSARARVALLRRDVARLTADLATQRRAAAHLVRQLEARTGQRNGLARMLQGTLARIGGIQGQNQLYSTALGDEAVRLTTTKQCLIGVRQALDQAAIADFSGTVASLRSVDSQCKATLARSSEAVGHPAYDGDFPDPSLVAYHGRYYGYATNGRIGTVQLLTGPTLASLTAVGNALTTPARWASRGRTWAPTVWRRGHRWVMYYTAQLAGTTTQCISRAVATGPSGPFIDDSVLPLICQTDLGGSIDPSPYVDEAGTPFLVWKSEGVPGTPPTRIWTQQLSAGGTAVVPGTLAALLAPSQRWEDGLIEGPSMIRHDGEYLLFYSANHWNTANYAVGYAVCRSPIGPCTRPEPGAVFRGTPPRYGAGGQELFTAPDGSLLMAYHAWVDGEIGFPHPRRLYLAKVTFLAGRPSITPYDIT